MIDKIANSIKDSIKVKTELAKSQIANIEKAATAIIESLSSGGKLIVFGNGGSAADSQHIAAELIGRFKKERRALSAIALTTNTSTLTALGNDYGYESTFSRQLEALGRNGDVALAISTSGNAKNVFSAVNAARKLSITTIALTGCGGGQLKDVCDISIVVPTTDTPRIQEAHIMIGHIICELVEDALSRA